MSLQRISGQFDHVLGTGTRAGVDLGYVLLDYESGGPAWTPGATVAQQLPIQPNLTEKWRILGWTISVIGVSILGGSNVSPSYGRFGMIWAGLLVDALLPTGAIAQLPQDLSTFAKLWDGGVDPTFPQGSLARSPPNPEYQLITSTRAPLGTTFLLPQPIAVKAGQQFQFGLILTPSLVSFAGVSIADAYYSVIYDDGT